MAQVVEILPHGRQKNYVSYITNTIAADDLVTQGARISASPYGIL